MKQSKSIKTYPISSLHFWLSYTIHMRPYLLFVSGIAGVAGIAMADIEYVPIWKLCILFIPFFLGYGFGQALTDCFQTDTDKISAPYRPLSQGIITIRSVLITSIAGLIAIAMILLWFHRMSFLLSILAVFGLASYSYVKKKFWFGGPFYNAWIMAIMPIIGYFAASSSSIMNFPLPFYQYVGLTFFSYTNFVLIGYLKDIEADKATNYQTFPVVFGWQRTVIVGDLIGIATIILSWLHPGKNVHELFFSVAATIVIIAGQIVAHQSKQKNEKEAMIPILSTVRSFVLFHLAVVLHFQPSWWIAAMVYYLLFEIVLYFRPSRYQV